MEESLVPVIARVEETRQETPDIKTLRLSFEDQSFRNRFSFKAGQFCLISVLGVGEATFCIASAPSSKEYFEISVKKVGKVTTAIHDLEVGDRVGFRGPYGNSFPLERMEGRNLLFVGGGIGLAPLRPLIWECLQERNKYGEFTLIYGARTTKDLVFKEDLVKWSERKDVKVILTVDPGGEDPDWKGRIGLVPKVLEEEKPSPDAILITCGPPIMIKFVIESARRLGFRPSDLITTLEMKMKCGVGLCGRCNIGNRYVCKDGPVFTLEEIQELPNEF